MIKNLSINISCYLCNQLKYNDNEEEIISYGLQILIGTLVKIITILCIAYLLDILKTTLIGLLSFIIFRNIIGGTHCDTYNKCFFTSTVLMILVGLLGMIVRLNSSIILGLLVLTYIQCLMSTIIWVPAGTKKKTIKKEILRKKIKIKATVLSTFWACLIFFLIDYMMLRYVFSSILGVSLAFLFTTPLAYKFTDLKLKKKRV